MSGLYANWVLLQESSRVGPSPVPGQGTLEAVPQFREVMGGGLTTWSVDLDGLTAGHGLGARLAHTFFTTEGHLVSNGERLPVRGLRKKVNTSCCEDSVGIRGLTAHVLGALWQDIQLAF